MIDVYIIESLNWTHHIHLVKSKLRLRSSLLYRASNLLDTNCLLIKIKFINNYFILILSSVMIFGALILN